jgi:hypothetical protein
VTVCPAFVAAASIAALPPRTIRFKKLVPEAKAPFRKIDVDAGFDLFATGINYDKNYIEYLRQTNKNLESLQFTIKNIIDLFNYLGR